MEQTLNSNHYIYYVCKCNGAESLNGVVENGLKIDIAHFCK